MTPLATRVPGACTESQSVHVVPSGAGLRGRFVPLSDPYLSSGAVGSGFVVAFQAAVPHEPAQCPLDTPAAWKDCKSPGGGGVADDVHVDAEGGGVLDAALAVTAVDPGLADGGVLGRDPLDQRLACDGVLHTSGGDQRCQQEVDRVGNDAPLITPSCGG
jgi:hypothetical protein